MDRQAARRSGGGAKKSVQATSHLKAMLQDQEDVASSVYAKRIVGWRMHTDDSPIEFAVREYAGADEFDADEERIRALGSDEECEEGFVAGFGEDDVGIHWVQIDNERVYGNGARELFSFLYQMGWRERPEVELGIPLPKPTQSKGFITIEGHGVGPLGIPMFRVLWANPKKGAREEESWIHAYNTVHCPMALLEYVAKDNYESIRLPRGLRVENFEAYVIEHYDWDMYEPEGDDEDEQGKEGGEGEDDEEEDGDEDEDDGGGEDEDDEEEEGEGEDGEEQDEDDEEEGEGEDDAEEEDENDEDAPPAKGSRSGRAQRRAPKQAKQAARSSSQRPRSRMAPTQKRGEPKEAARSSAAKAPAQERPPQPQDAVAEGGKRRKRRKSVVYGGKRRR